MIYKKRDNFLFKKKNRFEFLVSIIDEDYKDSEVSKELYNKLQKELSSINALSLTPFN